MILNCRGGFSRRRRRRRWGGSQNKIFCRCNNKLPSRRFYYWTWCWILMQKFSLIPFEFVKNVSTSLRVVNFCENGQWLCGSVGRAVASDTRGPRLESCHWQTICLLSTVYWKDKIKKKRPGIAHFLKTKLPIPLSSQLTAKIKNGEAIDIDIDHRLT